MGPPGSCFGSVENELFFLAATWVSSSARLGLFHARGVSEALAVS